MKIKPFEADAVARDPPRELIAALVFGPDAGLVRERAEILLKTVVDDLSDPFRVADLDAAALASDPARLSDEAAAIAMLGGRRVVRVRGATNAAAELFEAYLDDPKGDALIVVEAGDLAKSSALRKVFEAAANAAAIPCYLDSASNLAEVVRDALKEEGLAIAPEALDDAVAHLGSDRGVTRRELEKLALYARGGKQVTLDDVRAVMGDEAEVRIEEACDAAGAGDLPRLDLALERLWAAGVTPVAVLRQAMGHFQRLLLVKEECARGDIDEAIKRLRPPLHFSREASFKAQLRKWGETKLLDVLDRLLAAEVLCKTTAVPAEAACGRALFEVAEMGNPR